MWNNFNNLWNEGDRHSKAKERKRKIKNRMELVMQLNDEEQNDLENVIEHVTRLGPYTREKIGQWKWYSRPRQPQKKLGRTSRLKDADGCKDI